MLRKLCQVPFSALVIGGETGTGKGLATRILHYSGRRAAAPLVEINCAALPRELLESELFGHEAGAFTGARKRRRGLIEQASGGTLFLDEIGELELDLQAKLLKVIEDQRLRPLGSESEVTVDVQLIAASNRDLAARGRSEGSFRGDLFHRLSVFGLDAAGRCASGCEDLDDLVPAIVAEYNARSGKTVREIPDAVWTALKAYDWPGNVRELRNVIERCVLFADGDTFPAAVAAAARRQGDAACRAAAADASARPPQLAARRQHVARRHGPPHRRRRGGARRRQPQRRRARARHDPADAALPGEEVRHRGRRHARTDRSRAVARTSMPAWRHEGRRE